MQTELISNDFYLRRNLFDFFSILIQQEKSYFHCLSVCRSSALFSITFFSFKAKICSFEKIELILLRVWLRLFASGPVHLLPFLFNFFFASKYLHWSRKKRATVTLVLLTTTMVGIHSVSGRKVVVKVSPILDTFDMTWLVGDPD